MHIISPNISIFYKAFIRKVYILKDFNVFMRVKLHLHANFPHDPRRPNVALGYLKSALSEEKVDIKNVYWYLLPIKLTEPILSFLANFPTEFYHRSHLVPLFFAYLSRFLYTSPTVNTQNVPTPIESLLGSRIPLMRIERIGRGFKNFIDYSIVNEKMADADVAGFTVKLYQWFINKYVWSRLKEQNPNITIVIGGLDTKEEARAFMEMFKDVDCAVWGEGEVPLRELVKHINDDLDAVPHLVYRSKEGLHTTDVPSQRLTPTSFADHTDYFERLKTFELRFSPQVPIFGTRSCRWNRCKFCNLNKNITYYERPAKEVVEEIEYQSEKHGVDKFLFVDSDIGRKSDESFTELLTALVESAIRRKMLYNIGAEITPARMTRRNVEMMTKIRMKVQIGFEALTDPILKSMDKMHGVAENIQALKFGTDYGAEITGLNVLRNLPELSEQDIIESMGNLEFFRFFLGQYNLTPSELVLFKRARYFEEIPSKMRESRWVVNFLYTEMERLGLVKEDHRWDFFGFKACNLLYPQLWDHLAEFLEELQSSVITYLWLEFPDGSSLIREHNEVSGDKEYILDDVETGILKFCDSMKGMQQLKKEFSHVQNLDMIISQLREEHFLYHDKERKRLISVLSERALKKM